MCLSGSWKPTGKQQHAYHKSVETRHKITETQNKIIETQNKVVKTQHKITETQYKIIETQHKVVETKHKLPKHNTKMSKHNTKLSKQPKILADHSGKPRYKGMKTRRVFNMAVEMVMVCWDVSAVFKKRKVIFLKLVLR